MILFASDRKLLCTCEYYWLVILPSCLSFGVNQGKTSLISCIQSFEGILPSTRLGLVAPSPPYITRPTWNGEGAAAATELAKESSTLYFNFFSSFLSFSRHMRRVPSFYSCFPFVSTKECFTCSTTIVPNEKNSIRLLCSLHSRTPNK